MQQSIVNIYPFCSIIYNVARAFMILADPFIEGGDALTAGQEEMILYSTPLTFYNSAPIRHYGAALWVYIYKLYQLILFVFSTCIIVYVRRKQ